MSDFKLKTTNKKAAAITLIIISAIFVFVGIGGFINKFLIQGEPIEVLIPNFIVTPIGIIGLIAGVCTLKNLKKIIIMPIGLLFSYGISLALLAIGLFLAHSAVTVFLIKDNDTFAFIFVTLLSCGMFFGAFLNYKSLRPSWEMFTLGVALQKHNGEITEKKKDNLIKIIKEAKHLYIITDISINPKTPYINSDGAPEIYIDREYAQKNIDLLSINNKINFYFITTINTNEQNAFFQNLYNMGFNSIDFSTTVGSVNLNLNDLKIKESNDPIQICAFKFLSQKTVSLQQRARYSHMIQIDMPAAKVNKTLDTATQSTNAMIEAFKNSLFYVFAVPDNIKGKNTLNFSESAYEICQNKDFLSSMSFSGVEGFIKYPSSLTIPYIDIDYNNHQKMIITFSSYATASQQLELFKQQLTEIIDLEMESEEWQQKSEEYKMFYIANYLNDVKSISECDICVMTGNELEMYLSKLNCDLIVTDHLFKTEKEIFDAYKTDVI